MNPVPLPPAAVKVRPPRGEMPVALGVMETRGPTVTLAVAVRPRESVMVTTSVTLPVAPAVYAPLASMLPPDALVDRA